MLSKDNIDDAIKIYVDPVATYSKLHNFARAIEAEVRKQDEALIRQMLDALENHDGNYKLSKSSGAAVNAALTAARARLGETT